MSITGSLSNALSGLTAASRAAEVVSSNVANAMTEGYGRRVLNLSSRTLGGVGAGVQVGGVNRLVDEALISDRRAATSEHARADVEAGCLDRIEKLIGLPGEDGSLSARLVQFEGALVQATSRPDSQVRLAAIEDTATALANTFEGVSDGIQELRMEADRGIAGMVDQLNTALKDIEKLNQDISYLRVNNRDISGLLDQRQLLVDQLAEIVPVKTVPRDNGAIALFTPGGGILVDSRAANIGFTAVGVITPDMTLASTALSGLTINGHPVSTQSDYGPIAGGRLAAMFAVRDDIAVAAQGQLDAVARDLVERFQSPSVDPTLGPGDAGLFTDGGLPFSAADEVGLSGRLRLNALADPAQGGDLWRLRDGLGAAAPGAAGDAGRLHDLLAALETERTPASGQFLAVARTASGLSGDLLSILSSDRQAAEARASFAGTQVATLKTMELETGVDSDHEMQQLLLIEAAYSANARVIQTVDEMLRRLLEI